MKIFYSILLVMGFLASCNVNTKKGSINNGTDSITMDTEVTLDSSFENAKTDTLNNITVPGTADSSKGTGIQPIEVEKGASDETLIGPSADDYAYIIAIQK